MNSNIIFSSINKLGIWIVKKFVKKEEIKTRHFDKIKEEVLNPFLNMLRLQEEKENRMINLLLEEDFAIERRYESINSELFRDVLENHFIEIKTNKRKLEGKEKLFDDNALKITKKLSKQFNKNFYEDSVKRFFILEQNKYPNLNLHIDYDYLMYGSSVICCSNEEDSKRIKEELEKIYKNKIGKEIKDIYLKLLKSRKKLITTIERVLASEILKGRCDFIK